LRYLASLSNTVPPGCTPIGDPRAPSSFDKIGAALTAGTIGSETALLYNVYATFGDDALPPQFRGDDSGGPPDGGGVAITQSMLSTVSPETRALLAPFLIPPIYAGSWLHPQGAAAGTASVRVWWQRKYPGGRGAGAGDRGRHGRRHMAHPHRSDGPAPVRRRDNLRQRQRQRGHIPVGCGTVIDPRPFPAGMQEDVGIHQPAEGRQHVSGGAELMHTIQWGYDVSQGCMYQTGGEYNWLAEATANWAMDFVYPTANEEHGSASRFLSEPETPLDTRNDRHEYGAYLFFYYLTEKFGSPVVRSIWDNVASNNSLEAIDKAIDGGFDERWPEFAVNNWNRPPVDDYKTWDQLDAGAATVFRRGDGTLLVPLDGAPSRKFEVESDPKHLAAFYHDFKFNDDSVQSVVFNNTLAGYPHAAVQALVKIGGEWKAPRDWTGSATTTFCRDIDGQHIEELVIIISNSDWENKGILQPPEPLSFTASTAGCTDFVGAASVQQTDNYNGMIITANVSGLRFHYSETAGGVAYYKLTESPVVTVQASGGIDGCTISGEMTLQPADGTNATGKVQGNLVAHTYGGGISGFDPNAVPISYTCPDASSSISWVSNYYWEMVRIMDTGLPAEVEMTGDGRLDGVHSYDQSLGSGRWIWHFDPAPPSTAELP
jgi:hypothetical protein